MSGRKQHYIPKCLLAGFAVSPNVKRPQVFVYRRGSRTYPSWIGDVAAERDFYSDPAVDGTKSLDDEITSYENRFGQMLDHMRASPPGFIQNSAVPAELVTHLCTRAAFARNFFEVAFQESISGMGTLFSNSNAVRAHLKVDETDAGPLLSAEIDGAIDSLPTFPSDAGVRLLFKRLLAFGIREEFDGFYLGQMSQLNSALAALRSNVPDLIRNGHGRVLQQSKAPRERLEGLSGLRWWKVPVDSSLNHPGFRGGHLI